MKLKRLICILLVFSLCLPLWVTAAEETEEPAAEIIEATLDNAVAYSKGMQYIAIDPILNDDHTRALVYAEEQPGAAYVIYQSTKPFRSFAVETYMNNWARVNLKFYVSKDGQEWEFADIQLYSMDKTKHNDVWEATQQLHRAFEGSRLGDDYRYLKLEYEEFTDTANIISIHFSSEDVYKLGSTTRVAHSQKPDFDYSTIPSLKEEFKGLFDVGVSVEPWDFEQYEDLITSQFNVITTENQFKGHVVQTGPDTWNFNTVDQMVDWAAERGLKVRGHVLWYNGNYYSNFFKDEKGNPVSKEVALQRMENHVKTKVARYKGKIQYYDVINEVFDPGSGNLKSYMQEAQICGQDYIPLLFKWAREVDPDAVLILNDNSHLIPAQRNGIIKQVKQWLDEGVPIDAIGLQWHEDIFQDEADMRDLFEKLRDLGLPVYITELDMSIYHFGDTTTSYDWAYYDEAQSVMASMYATMFDIFREYADIIECVSFWNPTDNRSTVSRGDRYDFPLLFDMNGKPSANFWAVLDDGKTLPRLPDDVAERPEFARKYPDGYVPMVAPVYEGTPVIDGKIDDVWGRAQTQPVAKFCLGSGGATGTVRLLWDSEHLYALAEVIDQTPDSSSSESWNRDNLELFVSQSNMHTTYLGGGDRQYRIDPTQTLQNFSKGVCVPTETGYLYEVQMDMDVVKPKPGILYSFEAGIADAAEGIRNSISKWCDTTNDSYLKTVYWGDIVISDGTTPIPNLGQATTDNPDGAEDGQSSLNGTYADGALYYNGADTGFRVLLENGVAMIGLRDFLTLTDATVKTDKEGRIALQYNGTNIQMYMGQLAAVCNGNSAIVTAAPVVVDNTAWVPLRFVFEHTGHSVEWDANTTDIRVQSE